RAVVAAHVVVAHEPQHEVEVRAAPEGLTVGDNLLVWGKAGTGDPGVQLSGVFKDFDVGVHQLGRPTLLGCRQGVSTGQSVEPRKMNRPRNATCACSVT